MLRHCVDSLKAAAAGLVLVGQCVGDVQQHVFVKVPGPGDVCIVEKGDAALLPGINSEVVDYRSPPSSGNCARTADTLSPMDPYLLIWSVTVGAGVVCTFFPDVRRGCDCSSFLSG